MEVEKSVDITPSLTSYHSCGSQPGDVVAIDRGSVSDHQIDFMTTILVDSVCRQHAVIMRQKEVLQKLTGADMERLLTILGHGEGREEATGTEEQWVWRHSGASQDETMRAIEEARVILRNLITAASDTRNLRCV